MVVCGLNWRWLLGCFGLAVCGLVFLFVGGLLIGLFCGLFVVISWLIVWVV